jgi:hypothetical protein
VRNAHLFSGKIQTETPSTDELLSMEHLCKLMDEANPPKKRGPYKKATVGEE